MTRVNVVLFMPDELRADALACYGNLAVATPSFDALAAAGARFEQCHAQHTVCSPSRCSLMTGWYPHTGGHRTLRHLLRPHEPSLFRTLRGAGYRIVWLGKNDLYSEPYLREILGPDAARPDVPVEATARAARRAGFLFDAANDAPTEDDVNVARAVEFLRSDAAREQPFVLYLALSFPHPPYVARGGRRDRALPPLRPPVTDGKPVFHTLLPRYLDLAGVSLEEVRATYLAMVERVDELLARVLDAVDDETTAVVAFSDHGDWAGDYGLVEKWPSALDDTLTRVPLIVRAPGCTAGVVEPAPVELLDVMATVLDLTGVAAGHDHFARSLVPQLRGVPGDRARAVYAEGGYDPREPHAFEGVGGWDPEDIYGPKLRLQQEHPDAVCRAAMVRTLAHKLVVRSADVDELYDLERDPDELRNLHDDPAYADVRADLRDRLLRWYLSTSDVVPRDEDRRGFPS